MNTNQRKMENDYTPPNEQCKRLQEVIEMCEKCIKEIKDKQGTSKERATMEMMDEALREVISELV